MAISWRRRKPSFMNQYAIEPMSSNAVPPLSGTPSKRSSKSDYSSPIEPVLVPMYGCLPWTPLSECKHEAEPIKRGSHLYCEKCHQTGIEGHPIFHRDAIDRNGDRQWPEGETRTKYEPGEHAGGTGRLKPKTNRETREEQDRLYLALHEANWSIKTIAAKFDTRPLSVKAGIARARVLVEAA